MRNMMQIGQTVLHRYEILDIVATGGQADIAKARDTETGQFVAAKQLSAVPSQSNYQEELARFKRYAVLLERLWNSGHLRTTLAGLVTRCFADRVSDCFEVLLREAGPGLASDNLQPDSLFERIAAVVEEHVPESPELLEWLLWDYAHFSLPSSRTPAWIAERLGRGERIAVAGTRRRVPVLNLSQEGVGLINRITGQYRPAGSYAIWPMQHEKGKPVRVIPLGTPAGDVS